MLLNIYNPHNTRDRMIRVKVPNVNVTVVDSNNTPLTADRFCTNSTDTNNCDLFFMASLDGYSLNYYKVIPSKENNLVPESKFDSNRI